MSSTQNATSPRPPRPRHQHSKSATQVPPNINGKHHQRRQKGNRAVSSNHVSQPPAALDTAFAESAVLPSEEVQAPSGSRSTKKHTQSQPASDRVLSPTTLAHGSLTDSELAPNNPATTPAKAQGAYAGPTFHASPAPSALPIPKFLSKSLPPKSHARPPTPLEEGSDSSTSPTPSPSRAPIAVPSRHQDSPLDVLFNADRAERARNANCSPSSSISSPPSHISPPPRLQHTKHDSFGSMNAVFPIELDGSAKNLHMSPPAAAPAAHRSVTAPSKIPQAENTSKPTTESAAVQDLLDRLTQKRPTTSTPPHVADRIPSEPSTRMHSPSPFRSTSGPTTPAPAAKESPDFFYGNRNLSPLFKAAKTDSAAKRNSGLRTEVTADATAIPYGGFPSLQGPAKLDPTAVSRNYLDNMLGDQSGLRRGSAPHIPQYRDPPNNRKTRTPNRRSYHARPDSYPHSNGNSNGQTNGGNTVAPKPTMTPFSFVPSSVSAKQHTIMKPSDTKPSDTKPSDTKPSDLHASLELDLKRMLNLAISGDNNGVR